MENILKIDVKAPDFCLKTTIGENFHLYDCLAKAVIINFWSSECPWVERVDELLIPWIKTSHPDITLVAIASNANESPGMIQSVAAFRKIPLVLLDPDNKIADLYQAVTTPHFFVLDQNLCLQYQGAYDDVTFRNRTATRSYVRESIEAIEKGQKPSISTTDPQGCAIVRFSRLVA